MSGAGPSTVGDAANSGTPSSPAGEKKKSDPNEPVFVNPYRKDVLKWYKKILKAAFQVNWTTDDDASYVIQEAQKLFRQNMFLFEESRIKRKLLEAEQRYDLAVHYRIPYPRMMNKTTGVACNGGGYRSACAYASYLDSCYDGCPINPEVGEIEPGSLNGVYAAMTAVPGVDISVIRGGDEEVALSEGTFNRPRTEHHQQSFRPTS